MFLAATRRGGGELVVDDNVLARVALVLGVER